MNAINATEHDVLDLAPEVQLLRALVMDFLDTYDETRAAVIAWHLDGGTRPTKALPNLMDVQTLLDGIGKLASRMHTINQTGTISLPVFRRAVELMGLAVSTYVTDPQVLDKIQHAWEGIALDPKRKSEAIVDAEVIDIQEPE